MDNKFDNAQLINYNDYRGSERAPVVDNNRKEEEQKKNRRQIKLMVFIGLIGLGLGLSLGFWLGLRQSTIQVDERDISISRNGLIHFRGCPYFKENGLQRCQTCKEIKIR